MGDRARRVRLAGALILWAGAALAEDWKAVKGDALKSLFTGKELGDGAHFAYRFSADGIFFGTELGKDIRGAWRVKGNEMCWKWTRPPGAEECYGMQRDGSIVRLLKYGSEAWYGKLK